MNRNTAVLMVALGLGGVGTAAAGPVVATEPSVKEPGSLASAGLCGTRTVGADEAALVDTGLQLARVGTLPLVPEVKVIPVAFHVIYEEKKVKGQVVQTGLVSQSRVEAQIDVLNQAFGGTGFAFQLASISDTQNNSWFRSCFKNDGRNMKRKLAVSPATTLNVYSCDPDPYLSFSSFPWDYPEDSSEHGVVVYHDSIVGGQIAGYNEGDVLVHEVGHYLGLYHTFENGCAAPGDYVDDTPYEELAHFDCFQEYDTCPTPGVDPIHNYMDLTDDTCMDEFTAGQAVRMQDTVAAYRPSL